MKKTLFLLMLSLFLMPFSWSKEKGEKKEIIKDEIKLTVALYKGEKVSFNIKGENITIDWGDGKIEKVDSGFQEHYYNRLGDYKINIKGSKITDFIGKLNFGFNITKLNLRNNVNLKYLDCLENEIKKLDLRNNVKLEELKCSTNILKKLNLRKNVNLTKLDCSGNILIRLDLSKNVKLEKLVCSENKLTELDLSKNVNLIKLYCSGNELTELELSKNVNLEYLYCSRNKLTELDLRNNKNLKELKYEGKSIKKVIR